MNNLTYAMVKSLRKHFPFPTVPTMTTDLYPYSAPPVQDVPQLAAPPSSVTEMTFSIYLQVIVFFILSVVSVVFYTTNTKEQEDTVTALKRQVEYLEDRIEILSDTTKRRIDGILVGLEKQEEETRRLLEERFVVCESKLTQTTSDSVKAVKEEIELSVRSRIANLEARLPKPPRTVTVNLESIPLRPFYMNSGMPIPKSHKGPYEFRWSQLKDPRLVLTTALVPDTWHKNTQVPTQLHTTLEIKEPILTLTIPAGQKLVVCKAQVWHSTLDVVNSFEISLLLQPYFEI